MDVGMNDGVRQLWLGRLFRRGNPPGAASPYEVSGRGLKLFAKEVLPALKAQASAEVKAAAE
jgi:hypothetical protein